MCIFRKYICIFFEFSVHMYLLYLTHRHYLYIFVDFTCCRVPKHNVFRSETGRYWEWRCGQFQSLVLSFHKWSHSNSPSVFHPEGKSFARNCPVDFSNRWKQIHFYKDSVMIDTTDLERSLYNGLSLSLLLFLCSHRHVFIFLLNPDIFMKELKLILKTRQGISSIFFISWT